MNKYLVIVGLAVSAVASAQVLPGFPGQAGPVPPLVGGQIGKGGQVKGGQVKGGPLLGGQVKGGQVKGGQILGAQVKGGQVKGGPLGRF